jgi:hypothetical protein
VNSRYPIEDSLLYKKYKEDTEHIHKNRWYMSERLGYDVGLERAMLDWIIYHKQKNNLKTELDYTSISVHASASL